MSAPATGVPLDENELRIAGMGLYSDGEVMGLDRGGRVLTWDAANARPLLGGPLDELSLDELGFLEKDRLDRDATRLGLSFDPSPAPSGPRR